MKTLLPIVLLLTCALSGTASDLIFEGKLQTDLNANQKNITNINQAKATSLIATNFIDATTGLPLSTGSGTVSNATYPVIITNGTVELHSDMLGLTNWGTAALAPESYFLGSIGRVAEGASLVPSLLGVDSGGLTSQILTNDAKTLLGVPSTNGFVSAAQIPSTNGLIAQAQADDAATNAQNSAKSYTLVVSNNLAVQFNTNRHTWFNVLDYGAVTGGAVDCSTNIQLAIIAAEAAGGGTIYMPSGVYGIGRTNSLNYGFWAENHPATLLVRSNVPIRFLGDGMGQTILRDLGEDGWHQMFATGGVTNYPTDYGTNNWFAQGNLDFSNFTIDGAANGAVYDITELFSDGVVTFTDMEFINVASDCIDLHSRDAASLGSLIVKGVRTRNVGGNAISSQVQNLLVSDCVFDGSGNRLEAHGFSAALNNNDLVASYDNVVVMNYSRIYDGDATLWTASNCRFYGTNTTSTNFYFTTTHQPTFVNCQFEGAALNTIVTTRRGLRLIGCRFNLQGNGLDVLAIKPTELHIEGCSFGNAVTPRNQWNIQIQDGPTDTTSGKGAVKIINNSFMGFYYSVLDAINFTGTNGAYNALISGNIFANKNVKFNSGTNVIFTGNNWTTNGTLLATNVDYSVIVGNRFQTAPVLTLGNAANVIQDNIGLANSSINTTSLIASTVSTASGTNVFSDAGFYLSGIGGTNGVASVKRVVESDVHLIEHFIGGHAGTVNIIGELGWTYGGTAPAKYAESGGSPQHFGILKLATGTGGSNTSSYVFFHNLSQIPAIGLSVSNWTSKFTFKIADTNIANFWLGVGNSAAAPQYYNSMGNGFWCFVTNGNQGQYFTFQNRASTGDSAPWVSNSTVRVDTNWHTLSVSFPGDGTGAHYSLDGEADVTINGNWPGTFGTPEAVAVTGDGVTKALWVDKWELIATP